MTQSSPTDTYAKILAGRALEEGRGFPGVVEIGTPTHEMYAALGPGREVAGAPFWYFYDAGPWTLVVVAQLSMETGGFSTRAIQIAGDAAPTTKGGVRIGDAVAKVELLYGRAEPFSGTVGDPQLGHLVSIDLRSGAREPLADVERVFRASLHYPKLGTLFVVTGGVVSRIAAVVTEDPLPSFLRDPSAVKTPAGVVIDPAVDAPSYGPDPNSATLRVPPPPALAPVVERGFSVEAPAAWTRRGTLWMDPTLFEFVQVAETQDPGTPQAFFAAREASFGPNRVPPKQRALPAEFAELLGADVAWAMWKQVPGKGKNGQPLRVFALLAAKGDRRFTLTVGRTASGAQPSPDGEALARGVFRSFRIR